MIRITLLRHGKPAFELKGNIRGEDLGEVARSYDLSGIVDTPPSETVTVVQGAPFVVCSHLKRSLESARALGFSDVRVTDKLFGETAIPHFARGAIPLPVSVWIVALRLMWLLGFSRNGESLTNTRKRANHAAARLVELAEEHQDVLLVGHGLMNHFIAKELRKCGWHGPSRLSRGYWGFGSYVRATT
jgi:broad specificity phosphatase PhoE